MGILRNWRGVEARRAERFACHDMAVAEFEAGEARCLVLNRSEEGLLLEFREPPHLDQVFVLRDFAAGEIVRVRLVWTEQVRAGVALVGGLT